LSWALFFAQANRQIARALIAKSSSTYRFIAA
jgi:hypothetical protein